MFRVALFSVFNFCSILVLFSLIRPCSVLHGPGLFCSLCSVLPVMVILHFLFAPNLFGSPWSRLLCSPCSILLQTCSVLHVPFFLFSLFYVFPRLVLISMFHIAPELFCFPWSGWFCSLCSIFGLFSVFQVGSGFGFISMFLIWTRSHVTGPRLVGPVPQVMGLVPD